MQLGRQTNRQEDNNKVEATYSKIGSESSGLPGTCPPDIDGVFAGSSGSSAVMSSPKKNNFYVENIR